MSQTCRVTVTITNRLGLHARPAMCFVDLASSFQSDVSVCRAAGGGGAGAAGGGGGQQVDGKSIMQMMMLAATKGTQLDIVAAGPDAEQACDALKKLVEGGFDED